MSRAPVRRLADSISADVGHYLTLLVEWKGKSMATARMRLAAIAAAHRLSRHEDSTTRPLVKATMKRLAREYGKPRKQANGLTSEALAEDTYTFMACTLRASIPELRSTNTARQWERQAGHPSSFSGTRQNSPVSYSPARVN